MIDEIDKKILNIIQENARTTNAEIARQIGMAPSGIFERLRKLEERGIITGYTARLNAQALGYGLLAFIFVRIDEPLGSKQASADLALIPEVQEVHHIAGEDCFLVKVRTTDTQTLSQLLCEKFGAIPGIRSTRTTIVLSTTLELTRIPLTDSTED